MFHNIRSAYFMMMIIIIDLLLCLGKTDLICRRSLHRHIVQTHRIGAILTAAMRSLAAFTGQALVLPSSCPQERDQHRIQGKKRHMAAVSNAQPLKPEPSMPW
jgi:hypothetical protein